MSSRSRTQRQIQEEARAELREEIYDLLLRAPGTTTGAIAMALNRSHNAQLIERQLMVLRQEGRVTQTVEDSGPWNVGERVWHPRLANASREDVERYLG